MLVVSSELPPGPGGIGAHAEAVATGLLALGWEVAVLGSQDYVDDATRRAHNAGLPVTVSTFPSGGSTVLRPIRRWRLLRRVLADHRPDVVLATGGRCLWLCALALRRKGPGFVAVVHGTELGGPTWQRALTRRSLDQARKVVAVSRFTADLATDLGVDAQRIEVIPNGADGDRFRPDPERRRRFRARHGLGDRPLVLTVGNVTRRKGQHVLVEALPRVVERVPDVRYVLVGRPSEADRLVARAEALGVADHVVVLGQVDADEVTDAHAAADLFAMTSTNTADGDVEGYGIAVVEAALSGVPAVVTAGTGAAEAVVDGRTGVVSTGDPGTLASAIVDLLVDPERRRLLGCQALESARERGTWAHRVERYDRTLGAATKPRIVVVSHTEHFRTPEGETLAFGPTTRELDHLATLASQLVHVAPLHTGPPPGMALPITAANVRHVPVPTAGGPRRVDRILALRVVPRWLRTIDREVRSADLVHVRAPAGIAAMAFFVLLVRRRPGPRWVKYAGNWAPDGPDPVTYRFQRWWLRAGLARATVTVNGRWPDQPRFVRTFDNPTLTAAELEAGRDAAEGTTPGPPHRIVFAGRLEREKGAHVAVETVRALRARGIDVELDLLGDGPLRGWVEDQIVADGSGAIRLHGWVRRRELEGHLARGHVFLLPTTAAEGFPKVLGEALAFGCVPVTSVVSSIGQVLGATGGAVLVADDDWIAGVERALEDRHRLVLEGLDGAGRFSYAAYLDAVRTMTAEDWGFVW